MSDNIDRLEGLNLGDERPPSAPQTNSSPQWLSGSQGGSVPISSAATSENNAAKLAKLQDGQAPLEQHRAATPPNRPNNWGAINGPTSMLSPTSKRQRRRNGILIGAGGLDALLITVGITVSNTETGSEVSAGTIPEASTAPQAEGNVPETTTEDGEELFAPPSSVRELIQKVTASTVYIECNARSGNGGWTGSGFVLDQESLTGNSGLIVITNNHVIEDCVNQIDVIADGKTLSGTVVGGDADVDLAVVNVPNLTVPPLTPNLSPERGQWVMAAGAPEGIRDSIDDGSVNNVLDDEYRITTDAVLAHGSSGGPLVNSRGEVIGANSGAIVDSEDGTATGISIAQQIRGLCLTLLTCR